MEPIGVVKTPFHQKFGIPRQGILIPEAQGQIIFNKQRVSTGCLEGLATGDWIWVIFQFHKAQASKKGKVHPPRLEGKTLGVFASRSPHRPNPIGLTLCRISALDENSISIMVEGVDLINDTPILDIKPYLQYADGPLLSLIHI